MACLPSAVYVQLRVKSCRRSRNQFELLFRLVGFDCRGVAAVESPTELVGTADPVVVAQVSPEYFQHEVAQLAASSVAADAVASVGTCVSTAGEGSAAED